LSHYVTALLLAITRFQLLYDSWRGYLIAGFSLVWIANFYVAIFGRLRLEIKSQKLEIAQGEAQPPVIQREDSFAGRGSVVHR
jgi:hypothetical protein